MAYANVTALANMDAVLNSITTFLGTLTGWTVHTAFGAPSVGPGAGGGVTVASNGTTMVGMRSTDAGPSSDQLWLFSGLGAFSSGVEGSLNGDDGIGSFYNNTTATSGQNFRGFQKLVGPFPNLYMFSNAAGDYCHIVLEWSAGKFRHMAFGKVIKFGTWPGGNGSYFAGSFWSQNGLGSSGAIQNPADNAHNLPFDNTSGNGLLEWSLNYSDGTDQWFGPTEGLFGTVQHRHAQGTVRGGPLRMFKNIQESLFTGLIPMGPIVLSPTKSSDVPVTMRHVGQVPDMRTINIAHLTPAQEFSIGSDTWKVFPLASKGQTVGQESSLNAGLAYKKI